VKTLIKECVIDGDKILNNLERSLLRELSKTEYENVLRIIIEEKLNAYRKYKDFIEREIQELSTLLKMMP
jgi:hypothetical protein